MKKLAFLFVAFVAVVGFNVYAEGNGPVPPNEPGVDGGDSVAPYLCWWNGTEGNCVDQGEVGCICGELD